MDENSVKTQKLLMITTRPLIPNLNGYTLRMRNLLFGLKQSGYKITIISFCSEQQLNDIDDVELCQICDKFIPIKINRKLAYIRTLRALITGKPFKAEYYNSAEAKNIIKKEVKNNKYDYVCGYHYLTSQFLSMFPRHKRWIELCDAISMLHERNLNTTQKFLKKVFLMSERERVLKIEKECIKKYDLTTLISNKDKEYLSKYCDSSSIKIVPNGVNIPDEISTEYNKHEICFLGDMGYVQNHQAVMWFIENVLPDLIKEYPDIVFKIIGKNPQSTLLNKSSENRNIKVTGMVKSVVKEISTANFMACPISISAGIQNKVLESMAAGVPVIATSNVANPITDNTGIIMQANSKEEWINTIRNFIDNPSLRQEYSVKSREFVTQNFSWQNARKILEKELINEAIS